MIDVWYNNPVTGIAMIVAVWMSVDATLYSNKGYAVICWPDGCSYVLMRGFDACGEYFPRTMNMGDQVNAVFVDRPTMP